jgi:hypothetical protein
VIEIHKSVRGPDSLAEFLAGDHVARVFQQNLEDLKWLFLEPDSGSILAQLS